MKFNIISRTELEITAETPAEVREVVKHFKLDPFAYTEAYSTGRLVYVTRLTGRDNPGYFNVETHLGPEWVAPYMQRLKAITGYEGPIPGIDNVPTCGYDWNLIHTHQPTQANLRSDGLHVIGIQWSQDWNGKSAEERAPGRFAEYIRESLGATKHEPEYIPISGHGGNGLMKRNPNYLKHHAPHPEATNPRFFEALLRWWLDFKASPAQREIVEKALANHRTVCKTDTLGQWQLRSYDRGWRTDWKDGFVKIEDFIKLGA